MNHRYMTLWSMKTALVQSVELIRRTSHLRIAGFAVPTKGVGRIEKIAVDSSLCACFGHGKVINGFLIGVPTSN